MAGFLPPDKAGVNAHPEDTEDYPRGVWTLPPDCAMGELDRVIREFLKPVEQDSHEKYNCQAYPGTGSIDSGGLPHSGAFLHAG